MNAYNRGKLAEEKARCFLAGQGFAVMGQNVRNAGGEIDIIATKDGVMVFVEVKYRATSRYGSGRESIDARKQRHILDAAALYLQKIEWQGRVRFDVVEVDVRGGCHLIEAAFSAW